MQKIILHWLPISDKNKTSPLIQIYLEIILEVKDLSCGKIIVRLWYKMENKNRVLPAQVGCVRQVLGPGALGDPEGAGGEGSGRGDQDGEYM